MTAPLWRSPAMTDLIDTRTAERDAMRAERDTWIAKVAALTADLASATAYAAHLGQTVEELRTDLETARAENVRIATDALNAEAALATLTTRYRDLKAAHTGACRERNDAQRRAQMATVRAETAEAALRALNDENAALWASESSSDAIPDAPDPYAVTDIELTRLRRLLADLRRDDEERHAVVICRALDAVARITREVCVMTGRNAKRRAA